MKLVPYINVSLIISNKLISYYVSTKKYISKFYSKSFLKLTD